MGRSLCEKVERAWCSCSGTYCKSQACCKSEAAGIIAAPRSALGTACCSECPSASWWRRLENNLPAAGGAVCARL